MMEKEIFLEVMAKTHAVIEQLTGSDPFLWSACICGSSQFCDLIAVVKWELEKQGVMATGLHLLPEWYIENKELAESHHVAEQEDVAHTLDELHFRKIDECNCVLVVNPNNYIGKQTAIEINHAKIRNKPIFYWEPNENIKP